MNENNPESGTSEVPASNIQPEEAVGPVNPTAPPQPTQAKRPRLIIPEQEAEQVQPAPVEPAPTQPNLEQVTPAPTYAAPAPDQPAPSEPAPVQLTLRDPQLKLSSLLRHNRRHSSPPQFSLLPFN